MNGWVGFDLDGTLAEYHGWVGPDEIGAPVPAMVARAKRLISEGWEVRIFTARVCDPNPVVRPTIERWCAEHIGVVLPITNVKDFGMVRLYDDRAIAAEPNTGKIAGFNITDEEVSP